MPVTENAGGSSSGRWWPLQFAAAGEVVTYRMRTLYIQCVLCALPPWTGATCGDRKHRWSEWWPLAPLLGSLLAGEGVSLTPGRNTM